MTDRRPMGREADGTTADGRGPVAWTTLGSWWFLLAVAVLAVNDHVLKPRYGTWWTGKLSDLAGPVVVATLAAVLVDRRIAVAGTAVAFTLLKTIPAVAAAAAPILGGTTRTDATDLVGLLALVPTARLLRASDAPSTATDRRARRTREPGPGRSFVRRMIAGLGLGAAVLATTATSVVTDDVTRLETEGSTLYALVGDSDGSSGVWQRSDDGGRTWGNADGDPGGGADAAFDRSDCAGDHCYRLSDRRLERAPRRSMVWEPDPAQPNADGSGTNHRTDLAVVVDEGTPVVVVNDGAAVLVRRGGGEWERSVLGTGSEGDGEGVPVWFVPVLASAVIVGAAVILSGWRPGPSSTGLVAIALLVGAALATFVLAEFFGGSGATLLAIVFVLGTAVFSVDARRSMVRDRQRFVAPPGPRITGSVPRGWPPPPPPPPPPSSPRPPAPPPPPPPPPPASR